MQILKNNEIQLRSVCDVVPIGHYMGNELFDFMRQVMEEETPKGIGLAANQVGVMQRIIVIRHAGIDMNILNPEITKHCNKKTTSVEMCLSCPGIKVSVGRWKWVILKGFDENWKPIKKKFHGLLSCVVQHEIDHLNGITLLTRVTGAEEEAREIFG